MRKHYALVFEFPDDTPDSVLDSVGTTIEDMMNETFPTNYQDVMWSNES